MLWHVSTLIERRLEQHGYLNNSQLSSIREPIKEVANTASYSLEELEKPQEKVHNEIYFV